jgi:hypothetical protein
MNCLSCNKDISDKIKSAKFCNQKCRYSFNKIIKVKKCVNCELDITHKPGAKYCSRKCSYEYQLDKSVKYCNNEDCGKILENKNRKAKFCTKSCKSHQTNINKKRKKIENSKNSYKKCNNPICNNNISHLKKSTKYCSMSCGKKVRRKLNIEKDIYYLFRCSISCSIKRCFSNKKIPKLLKTYDILGCAIEEFKEYIENKFEPWMTWENRGLYNGELNYGWDMDHKIPISSAETEEDIIRLSHYTNFQPLCSYTNRYIKKDNY